MHILLHGVSFCCYAVLRRICETNIRMYPVSRIDDISIPIVRVLNRVRESIFLTGRISLSHTPASCASRNLSRHRAIPGLRQARVEIAKPDHLAF